MYTLPQVISSEMLFNTTSLTYRIIVRADLPIYNPNMLSVKLSGQLNVSFYDQQAGWAQVQATTIDRRAAPQVRMTDGPTAWWGMHACCTVAMRGSGPLVALLLVRGLGV
jgi:hypothetical protein